jgi:hypothetical protein
VQADALSIRLPRHPFRVVASPPYAIASPLLRLLLAPSSQLIAADLVLQRAVVRRYGSGQAGRRQKNLRAGVYQDGSSALRVLEVAAACAGACPLAVQEGVRKTAGTARPGWARWPGEDTPCATTRRTLP